MKAKAGYGHAAIMVHWRRSRSSRSGFGRALFGDLMIFIIGMRELVSNFKQRCRTGLHEFQLYVFTACSHSPPMLKHFNW